MRTATSQYNHCTFRNECERLLTLLKDGASEDLRVQAGLQQRVDDLDVGRAIHCVDEEAGEGLVEVGRGSLEPRVAGDDAREGRNIRLELTEEVGGRVEGLGVLGTTANEFGT